MRGKPPPFQNAEDFCLLYSRAHLIVYRYIYGLYGPGQEVEDLTAETFMRAWKSRTRFNGDEGAATGWLLKIARNLVIDAYRRNRASPPPETMQRPDLELEFDFKDEEPGPEDVLLRKERLQTLMDVLATLSADQREMLVLRYILGWQVNQIAAHLEMLENTVSVYLRRALQQVKENWPISEDPL